MRLSLYLNRAFMLALGTALSWPISAFASDVFQDDMDEIVTVGQWIGEAKETEIASPVSVVSRVDIENRNQTYIAEILRSLPGVSVNQSGPGSSLTQIRMRGTEASHVLVIIDGVEMTNPAAGEFDFSGLRAADIVRVEVLRGEQSALYGSDAIGGVINITTRAGSRAKSWTMSAEAGSFGTASGSLNAVIPMGQAALSVTGSALTSDGYDISGQDTENGGEADGSASRALSIGLNRIEAGPINLSAKYSFTRLDAQFDEDLTFSGRLDDTEGKSRTQSQAARLDAAFDLGSVANKVTLSGQRSETDTQASFSALSNSALANLKWTARAEFGAHSLSALGEGQRETYKIEPSFAANPDAATNRSYGLAADYRYKMNGLSLTASARQDFNDLFKDALTWNLGAAYKFGFGGTLHGVLGAGVKNPSMIELFGYYPEANFTGNPDLRPETSLGYTIGYEQRALGGDLRGSIYYFRSKLRHEIYTDYSAYPAIARNRDSKSKRSGFELEAAYTPGRAFDIKGSATFLDSRENGSSEIRRPDVTASLTSTWSPAAPFRLTGSLDYTGPQRDIDFASFDVVKLKAFTLVGLNAAYDVRDRSTLTLRAENLLDEHYQEVVGYASQGRAFYAGLHLRFD